MTTKLVILEPLWVDLREKKNSAENFFWTPLPEKKGKKMAENGIFDALKAN